MPLSYDSIKNARTEFMAWAAFGGVVFAIVVGIASQVSFLAAQGWAAVTLVAFALTIAAGSAGITAWRYFHPLPQAALPPAIAMLSDETIASALGSNLDERIRSVEGKIDVLSEAIGRLNHDVFPTHGLFQIEDTEKGSRIDGLVRDVESLTTKVTQLFGLQHILEELGGDVRVLQHYLAYQANVSHLQFHCDLAPYKVDNIGAPGTASDGQREAMDKYVRRIERITSNSRWDAGIATALAQATHLAEQRPRK